MYNLRHCATFARLWETLDHIYKSNMKTESKARIRVFELFGKLNYYLVYGGSLLYIGLIIVVFNYPFCVYFLTNKIVPFAPVYMPGIDEETTIGFIILISVLALGATDISYAILFFNVPIFPKLIEIEILKLNRSLRRNSYGQRKISWKFHLRNILLMHLESMK